MSLLDHKKLGAMGMNSRRQTLLTRLAVVLDITELSHIALVISTILYAMKQTVLVLLIF